MKIISENPLCRSALIYAAKYNLPVFPSSRNKMPLIRDWYNQASKDLGVIYEWWKRWPDANVSMPTGSKSGIVVLDVDVKNGQTGFDSLRELEMKYGDLPSTPASMSPSGGQHFFFLNSGPHLDRKICFMPGLDLMGETSQVLLPPSIGKNGKKYTWEISGRIDENSFAPIPSWLKELTLKAQNPKEESLKNRQSTSWRRIVAEGVKEGKRNQSIAKLAGYLLRRYVDPYLALELIQIWNRCRNSPPLSEAEVLITVNSIAGKEARRRKIGSSK